MKTILVCFFLFFALGIIEAQETREIVTIKVETECKSHINSNTYKNEIATLGGVVLVLHYTSLSENAYSSMGFIYKENPKFNKRVPIIQFGFNSTFLNLFDLDSIYLNIDDKDFHLDKTIDYQEMETKQGEETDSWHFFSFLIDEALHSKLDNFTSFSFSVKNKKTGDLKTWKQKGNKIKKIQEMFDCFVSHYKSLEESLNKEDKKVNDVITNPSSNSNNSTTKECSSVQCSGATQKGSRCKNKTTNCNGRCHLH